MLPRWRRAVSLPVALRLKSDSDVIERPDAPAVHRRPGHLSAVSWRWALDDVYSCYPRVYGRSLFLFMIMVVVVVVSTLTVLEHLTQPHPVPYHRSTSLSAQTSSRAAASTGFFHRSIGVRCVGICVQFKRWVVS